MKQKKPAVGIILASHVREPSSFSLELLNSGVELLKKRGATVHFNGNACASDAEIRREIRRLKAEDPDAYIVCPGNWIEPPVLCHPLEEIRHEHILLWGFPESLKLIREGHFLGSNSAFTVLRSAMRKMDFRFRSIQEFPGEEAARIIYNFLRAAAVSRRMREAKLGLIGYCSMGIYTTLFDQHRIRSVFGTEIDTSADSYILCKKMEDIPADEVDEVEERLKARCRVDEVVVEDRSLDKSVQMYIALKNMARDGNWAGLSVKCQHEYSTYLRCTACLPLSMLTDEGIMCTDEGDVHALLTMVVMRLLSDGEPIYFGDIYKLEEGGFLMDHCGLSPHSCAGEGERVSLLPQTPRISKDGHTTGGVVSSYSFREGEVTIGRIESDPAGDYCFHLSRGEVKPIESIAYGWSSLIFTPEGNDGDFADRQLANHYIFVYADIEDRIEAYCSINDLKVIT
jgi:L-fucose isomerase-like protein